jgi:tRNA-dihydrouridine synthase
MNFWKQLRRPIKVQAPMEEFTDASFRELLLRFGRPDVFYTEFVNCDGYCSAGRQAVEHRLQYSQAQHPIVAQIWGKLPENFYRTAAALQQLGFDGIDINLGCSVPKVLKNSLCAGLIKYPEQVVDIFNAVKKGAPHLPISIKTRIGYVCIVTLEWIS